MPASSSQDDTNLSSVKAWDRITSMNTFHPFIENHGKVSGNFSTNLVNKLDSSKKGCLISSWKCQEDSLLQETPLQQVPLWKARSKRQRVTINITSISYAFFTGFSVFSFLFTASWVTTAKQSCLMKNFCKVSIFFPSLFTSSLI